MSRDFDYQSASVQEIAVRLHDVQNQAYSRLLAYYTNSNRSEMVSKLVQARLLSKILKLQKQYAEEYGV